ncbi:MAG: sulfotransferase family 2 domain-containing protein [Gammaproteobacteria bacterium]
MKKSLTFLRIPKNASTSIYTFFGLANTIRNEYLDANNSKYLNIFESSHCTLKEAKGLLGDCVAELPILSVVRNPYDRMVSMFFFAKKHNLGQLYDISLDSFDAFVEGFYKLSEDPDFFHAKSQCDYISGSENVTVCRFENLESDVSKFISDNSLSFNIDTFPKLNGTTHNNYKGYYTNKSKDIVKSMWKDDLTRFSYSF